MRRCSRRDFLKLGAATASILAVGEGLSSRAFGGVFSGKLKLDEGGRDFSPTTGREREVIPSACWQCVARDSILCFVEDGRLVKIEGNPLSM